MFNININYHIILILLRNEEQIINHFENIILNKWNLYIYVLPFIKVVVLSINDHTEICKLKSENVNICLLSGLHMQFTMPDVYMYVFMYVCMYVCIYACIYVCMYIYIYIYVYVCMYVCIYVCM